MEVRGTSLSARDVTTLSNFETHIIYKIFKQGQLFRLS